MSSQAVEARSLQSLTALASNPPSYPRNPTHVKHEPLVLYIARVPGSKDVFLTPMKPREKVVTAEDITSSLYFLHVEQPEDAQLIESLDFRDPDYSERHPASTDGAPTPVIARKAVPAAAPMRKPVPGTLAPVSDFESRQNTSARNYAQRPESLAPSYTPRYSSDTPPYGSENERQASFSARQAGQAYPVGVTLTLIRRHPATGAQWNVARIEDPPVIEVSSTGLSDPSARKKIGAPIYIQILNPGYSKFLHSDNTSRSFLPPRPSDPDVELYEGDTASPSQVSNSYPDNLPPGSENTFRRRLWMEGSQYTNGGFGHRKKVSYDFSSERPSSRGSYASQPDRPSLDYRTSSSYSFASPTDQGYSTTQGTAKNTFFRGYVFTSPWNGRCEFIDSIGGGTLKCRHIIPGLQGTSPSSMLVSELRFNLPKIVKTPSPRPEESSKRSSFFHRGRHSRNSSSVDVNREDGMESVRNSLNRLDLTLGQEYAGGGMGGKQAKLGKLIIEDEGLKMMDLLVAANLALWWRAYEKTSLG